MVGDVERLKFSEMRADGVRNCVRNMEVGYIKQTKQVNPLL